MNNMNQNWFRFCDKNISWLACFKWLDPAPVIHSPWYKPGREYTRHMYIVTFFFLYKGDNDNDNISWLACFKWLDPAPAIHSPWYKPGREYTRHMYIVTFIKEEGDSPILAQW